MLIRSEAVEIAAAFIVQAYPDKERSLVMLPEDSVEYAYGWAVRFDWAEHIKSGNVADAPFVSVVIVPHDGEPAEFPPTAFPVSEYMDRRASGAWPTAD